MLDNNSMLANNSILDTKSLSDTKFILIKLSKTKPLLLYSGTRVLSENGCLDINLNFLYLTKIDIPKVVLFLYQSQNYLLHKNLKYSDIQNIKKNLPLKVIVKSISTLPKILKNNSNLKKIYTLSNYSELALPELSNLDSSWLDDFCRNHRKIKTPIEINKIRESSNLVSQTIWKICKGLPIKKYKTCAPLVKKLHQTCPLQKIAYRTICSTGQNITELHYPKYDSTLHSNSLILLDMGFKYEGYCCDITRMIPKSGKFTANQKILYQIVLDIQEDIIKKLKPGISFKTLESDCYLELFVQLKKINLVIGNNLSNSQKIDFIKGNIMYHGLGHPIGLDVHDIGPLDILEKNMVITVEPGIYLRESLLTHELVNSSELTKYLDIGGIRIEDTIQITSQGSKILNKINARNVLPKKIKELEKYMK